MKIAVLSPHRGDAAFSLSLTIEAWTKAGHKVVVLNCFSRSGYAPFAETEFVHSNDRLSFVTALHGKEDEVWRRKFGSAVTLVDVNMKDAARRLHKRADEVYGLVVDPADKAIEKIQKAVEGLHAAAVVMPLGLGGHVDHLLVREACSVLARGVLPCAFYEDLPDGASMEGEGIEGAVRELGSSLNGVLVESFASEVADVAEALKRKRRLVLCYDSQVDDATVAKIAEFSGRYAGRERLWANAAWMDAGPKMNVPRS